jgi:hypothetical protein
VAPTLTASFDTRIILAACRDIPKEQMECITVGSKDQGLDQLPQSVSGFGASQCRWARITAQLARRFVKFHAVRFAVIYSQGV